MTRRRTRRTSDTPAMRADNRINVEATTVIARRTHQDEIPVGNAPNAPVIDLRVGLSELQTVAISEWRSRLTSTRDKLFAQLKSLERQRDAKLAAVQHSGEQFVKNYQFDTDLLDLCRNIGVYTGMLVTPGLRGPDSYYYSYNRGGQDKKDEPDLNIETRTIKAKVRLSGWVRHEVKREFDDFDRIIEVPVPDDVRKLIEEAELLVNEITALKLDLNEINRNIADLPNKGELITATLTKAVLTGRLTDPGKILEIIEETMVKHAALPHSVAQRMQMLEHTPANPE